MGILIVNAAALIVVLLFLGQSAANLFFPPLQAQLRKAVLRRSEDPYRPGMGPLGRRRSRSNWKRRCSCGNKVANCF